VRVGGRYRIDNELPDGRVLVIAGEFVAVDAPTALVYTWRVAPSAADAVDELVTVEFLAHGTDTEVVITHERVVDERKRGEHEDGWKGCLDRLGAFVVVTART